MMASELEMRIRALTTAIHLIQTQSTPISGIAPTYRALSKAYNHLATLLSQGSDVNDSGSRVVAVTGNADRSAICAVIVKHRGLTQNKCSGSGDLRVKKIEPSTSTLRDLADPSKHSPTQEVSLDVHGSDLFRALLDLSNDRSRENIDEFMRFVWLRCHRKMKRRLKADEVMLGTPLHRILQGWNLEDGDAVEETYFRVHQNLYESFDSLQIPSRVAEGTTKREYQFSRSTVPAWCLLFVGALAGVKEQAETCDMEPGTIDKLTKQLSTLNSLLHDNKAFETILALYSLDRRVYEAMRKTEKGRLNVESIPLSDDDDDFGDPLDEDLIFDPRRSLVLRCCMTMVAWHRAGLSLSRSKVFKGQPPQFYVLSAHSVIHSSMTDLRTLMMDVILPELKHIPNAVSYVEQLLGLDKFVKKKEFAGEIHCEATMMALIHSFMSTPSGDGVAPDLRPLFSETNRVIGVAKKPCLCCYWLGGLLQSNTKESFCLPGTHGIIFPWTPPVFGVPVPVLERLQQMLISKLTEVTATWIGHHPPAWYSNRQSSPADFDDD